jgi:hypothetical protein
LNDNNSTIYNNFTDYPFLDIPASLVEEMLSKTTQIGNDLFNQSILLKRKNTTFVLN